MPKQGWLGLDPTESLYIIRIDRVIYLIRLPKVRTLLNPLLKYPNLFR
jgi:hypothetical protein